MVDLLSFENRLYEVFWENSEIILESYVLICIVFVKFTLTIPSREVYILIKYIILEHFVTLCYFLHVPLKRRKLMTPWKCLIFFQKCYRNIHQQSVCALWPKILEKKGKRWIMHFGARGLGRDYAFQQILASISLAVRLLNSLWLQKTALVCFTFPLWLKTFQGH